MINVLTAFHHRGARRIIGITEKRGSGGEWEYPVVEEAIDFVGLHPIGVYIKGQQTTISQKMAFRPVYALCTEADKIPGTIRMVCWWDQDTVNEMEE